MAAGLAPADRLDEPRATALRPRAPRRVSVRHYPIDGVTSHRLPRQERLDPSSVLHTVVDNRTGRDRDRYSAPGLPQGPEFQGQAAITAAPHVPADRRYEEWRPPAQSSAAHCRFAMSLNGSAPPGCTKKSLSVSAAFVGSRVKTAGSPRILLRRLAIRKLNCGRRFLSPTTT